MGNIFWCWRASETSCQLAPVVPAPPVRAQLQLRGFASLHSGSVCLAGGYRCCTLGAPASWGLAGNEGISLVAAQTGHGVILVQDRMSSSAPHLGRCGSLKPKWTCHRDRAQLRFSYQGTQGGNGGPWARGLSLQLAILPLPSLAHGNSQRCSQHWLCPCCLS